jgi:hypothetical protein
MQNPEEPVMACTKLSSAVAHCPAEIFSCQDQFAQALNNNDNDYYCR